MRKRIAIITMFCLCFITTAYSSTAITLLNQMPRSGDTLYKQQVEFKDPGRRGVDVLWDFSKLKSINEKYKVRYYTPAVKRGGDSACITCLEHRTMYKYVSKGDSLLLMGFENSGSKLTLASPQYVMHFPFILGDSISSIFMGAGSYDHLLSTRADGHLTVVADAMGTLLLPDGDTLYDVLRIRSVHDYKQRSKTIVNERRKRIQIEKDSSIFLDLVNNFQATADSTGSLTMPESTEDDRLDKLKNKLVESGKGKKTNFTTGPDSIYFRTETCRWYAPGYRYPLFETIRNFSRLTSRNTAEIDDISTAFCFKPSMHTYLENDQKNKVILDSLHMHRVRSQSHPNDTLLFDYNLYPNPVRTNLSVELLLDLPSKVRLVVCSMSGNPELQNDFGNFDAGQHTLTQSLGRLNAGYHVLHIQVNEQAVRVVVLKN